MSNSTRQCEACGATLAGDSQGRPRKFCVNCRPPKRETIGSRKIEHVCLECGMKFVGSSQKKYCSQHCRDEVTKRRKRESHYIAPGKRDRCSKCGKRVQRGRSSLDRIICSACRDLTAKKHLKCSVDGCCKSAYGRGLCSTHYSYWYRKNVSGDWHPKYWVSDARRLRIYERDRWICQLCGRPVSRFADPQRDNDAPSLDHIIPKSTQLVPDHSDSNLQLAHRGCNARRGAMSVDEFRSSIAA